MAPIEAVLLNTDQHPNVKGLVVMDSPGRTRNYCPVWASAGANIIAFTTGLGAPQGFPFVACNQNHRKPIDMEKLRDHIDLDVSAIMGGTGSIPREGSKIF